MTAVQLALGVRPTSFLALREIRERGLLGRMALEVYEALCRRGPMTGREIDAFLARPGETRTSYHKRLPELARMGLARSLPARPCVVTGQLAVAWEALDRMPEHPAARPTRLEAFTQQLRARLEQEPGRIWTVTELADLLAQMSGGRR